MRDDGGGCDIATRRGECSIDLGGQDCDAPRVVMFALSPLSFANRRRPLTCTLSLSPPIHNTQIIPSI